MAGIFDSLLGSDDPREQAYMALAAGLLSGRGNFGKVAGEAMMGSQDVYRKAQEAKARREQQAIQQQMLQMQLDAARRSAKKEQDIEQQIPELLAAFPQSRMVAGPPTEAGAYPMQEPGANDYMNWALRAYTINPGLAQSGWKMADATQSREDRATLTRETQAANAQAALERQRAAAEAAAERQRESIRARQELAALMAANRPAPSPEPLVQVEGQDGKAMWLPRSQAIGKPVGGAPKTEKNLTEDQGKATSWLERMRQSEEVVMNAPKEALTSIGSAGGMAGATIGSVPFVGTSSFGKMARNFVESPQRQAVRTAQEAWVAGLLRSDTGAAYKDMEKDDIIRTFFPQPGEDDAQIALKKNLREGVYRAMMVRAGPGVDRLEKTPRGGGGTWTIEVEKP